MPHVFGVHSRRLALWLEMKRGPAAFSDSYGEARTKFVDAARSAGAGVYEYRHPTATGPDGEALYLDVAIVGPADGERVLVAGCGTHGIEGYAGSAAQTAWLAGGGATRLPKNVAVTLLHAHNPWGFAHKARVTEENVDLNRNFVDHARPYPPNPGYEGLHAIVTPTVWDEATIAEVFRRLDEFRERLGEQQLSDAFHGGQYTHHDGLMFGGGEQWSNRTFRQAVHTHVGHAKHVAMIDFHTGMGQYLDHVFVCFHLPGTVAYERARAWWGERVATREGITHKALARYHGLLLDAFIDTLPHAQVTATSVEFGTHPHRRMQRAHIGARWLRYHGSEYPELARTVHAEFCEAFYPQDPRWRDAVLAQSSEILERAIIGLAALY